MKVCVIGYGYWGPNLARNFVQTPGASLIRVVDFQEGRLQAAKKAWPFIDVSRDIGAAIDDPIVDAVVVATPPQTHFEIAMLALKRGKHVLVEKPLALSTRECKELEKQAKLSERTLMVDHTFLYTGAVEKISDLVRLGELGELRYFDSTRINLGLFQTDINVLWDLAAHDLSILCHLIKERPRSVIAVGKAHLPNHAENIAYLTLNFDSGLIAHFHCSWVSPVKVRKILIGGSKRMLVYDDVEPTEKLRLYDSGYEEKSPEERGRLLVDYRVGDILVPKISTEEALSKMVKDFVKSSNEGSKPRASGDSALQVVEILEAAQKSIDMRGKETFIHA